MIRLFAVALTATFALAPAAHSQSYDADAGYDPDASYGAEPVYAAPANYGTSGRIVLGHGRLTNNDLLGDLDDRWQTGSVSSSRVVGRNWSGMLPDRPFNILEYRSPVRSSRRRTCARPTRTTGPGLVRFRWACTPTSCAVRWK
jgi:hypothetical protein